MAEPARRSDPTPGTPPLDRSEAEEIARTLRVVADPTRLQLLSVISASPSEAATVGELAEALGLRQPTVTHHLRILVEERVLVREPRGRQVWLSIADDRKDSIADLLR